MGTYSSEFLHVLSERGYIHQCTNTEGLDKLALKENINAYIGFDCTAESLHVGSLVQIMMLRWLQKTGHKPIVLLGGGTTQIGDPSGKDESRKLLTKKTIASNKTGIKKCFENFLSFGNGSNKAIIVDNEDWLSSLEYVPFLREVGRHFSINRMLTFDSVKSRLDREQPLTFLEFNYMILQAYDFMELNHRLDCKLQMGGSDQWGNIVNGVELIRRTTSEETFGITTPLITLSSGEKMGKTANGAVWINSNLLSPYEYWQFWRNTADNDVGRFLRLFTELPLSEIVRLESLKNSELNEAKKLLANEATTLCHGLKAAEDAAKSAKETFEKNGFGNELPTVSISKHKLENGVPLIELLVDDEYGLNLVQSKSEVRRLVRNGGIKVNNQTVKDESKILNKSDSTQNKIIKISVGKKRHAIVKEQ
tara:strand:- start:274 stop:1539 length:1266 start_codon:yes stop_codon:yes gene_type:complete